MKSITFQGTIVVNQQDTPYNLPLTLLTFSAWCISNGHILSEGVKGNPPVLILNTGEKDVEKLPF